MELPKEELSPLDFRSSKSTRIKFPKSSHPGKITEFKWKDYCPTVFRNLQALDDIDYDDYMLSLCSREIIMKISLWGKSSHPLCLAHDDQFVIKILHKSEMKVLMEMLPNYYLHIKKYETTLLTKFYGLHHVRPVGHLKVYFVLMGNIFRSDLYIHRHYNLKGSSQGRSANKVAVDKRTTFKDLDLDFCFHLDPLTRHRLLMQIMHDCEFLEGEGIMDYSLLLGLHVDSPSQGSVSGKNLTSGTLITCDSSWKYEGNQSTVYINDQHSPVPNPKFGMKLPARAFRIPKNEKTSASMHRGTVTKDFSSNVRLYVGIVDILQGYNMIKRIEHAYKSIQFDSQSISAVNPKVYSTRFQDFLCRVFPEEKPDV